jgi:hypothetical protein
MISLSLCLASETIMHPFAGRKTSWKIDGRYNVSKKYFSTHQQIESHA